MPGAVPATSTPALTNATLPYTLKIADLGWEAALAADPALAKGLNATSGKLTNEGVAAAHGLELASI
jgi:alanine dehydrogenase